MVRIWSCNHIIITPTNHLALTRYILHRKDGIKRRAKCILQANNKWMPSTFYESISFNVKGFFVDCPSSACFGQTSHKFHRLNFQCVGGFGCTTCRLEDESKPSRINQVMYIEWVFVDSLERSRVRRGCNRSINAVCHAASGRARVEIIYPLWLASKGNGRSHLSLMFPPVSIVQCWTLTRWSTYCSRVTPRYSKLN